LKGGGKMETNELQPGPVEIQTREPGKYSPRRFTPFDESFY